MTATSQEVRSKTKELQEWLDSEIKRLKADISLLEGSIRDYERRGEGETSTTPLYRYQGLTSNELEAKLAEDRRKVVEYKRQFELLQSAKELNIDVDVIEKIFRSGGIKVEVFMELPDPYLCWWKITKEDEKYCQPRYELSLGSRRLAITYRKSKFETSFSRDIDSYVFRRITGITFGHQHENLFGGEYLATINFKLQSEEEITITEKGNLHYYQSY